MNLTNKTIGWAGISYGPVADILEDAFLEHHFNDCFPVTRLLENSLYYPASNLDGSPIKLFNGAVHSFVYADYGVSQRGLLDEVRHNRVLGYRVLCHRFIKRDEFPHPLIAFPFNPRRYFSQHELRALDQWQEHYKPYAHWSIWERRANFSADHGPARFSLLFVSGEAIMTWINLYRRFAIAPRILYIVNFGCIGGEWTNLVRVGGAFHELTCRDPHIRPEYLATSYKNDKQSKIL